MALNYNLAMVNFHPVLNAFRHLYRLQLRPALLVLVLPFAIVASYSATAYIDLQQYKQHIENLTGQPHIDNLVTIERFRLSLRKRLRQDIDRWLNPAPGIHDDSKLKTYFIYVDPEEMASLNVNLPNSGRRFIDGYMLTSESSEIQKMKLRYRGTIPSHWAFRQKSLRIKLVRGELNQLDREFNLVNPPHKFFPIDYVSYDISREAGLLAPDSEPVRVFVNNEYMGLYSYLSQVDESTLRKNRRMPGSVYYGEQARYSDEQGVNVLWKHAPAWRKRAARNLEESEDRTDIEALIAAVNDPDPLVFYDFFNRHANKHKFYTFFGIDTLVGSMHHDYSHNHRLYFSPYKGRFEPIQWDVRFWLPIHAKDAVTYPLLTRVMLNPVLEMERDRVGYRLLKNFPAADLVARLRRYQALVQPELELDVYRDDAVFHGPHFTAMPFTLQQFNDSMDEHATILEERAQVLEASYAQSEVRYRVEQLDQNITRLRFQVSGNSPASLDLAGFFPQKGTGFAIYQDRNGNGLADADEREFATEQILYPGRKLLPGNETWGNPATRGVIKLRPAPLDYDYLVVNGGAFDASSQQASNSITGGSVSIREGAFESTAETASVHPWQLPRVLPRRVVLNGDIEIDEDRVYEVGTEVVIEPGTRVRLAPGKSIFFYDRVLAIGNERQPIRFEARDADSPWGSVVIQGPESAGSELSHVQISNGSTTRFRLVNYPGQLNVHDSPDFTLTHCLLGKNHVGDDNLHIANTNAIVDRCVFYRSHRDAVDVDVATIEITNSTFLGSGNDSLDFMTTKFEAANNVYFQAGDKCLSIGEWSEGTVRDSLLMDCHTGIAVKDRSVARVDRVAIENAQATAVSLYRKNYRYGGGGELQATELYLVGNDRIEQDTASTSAISPVARSGQQPAELDFLPVSIGHSREWEDLRKTLEEMTLGF